MLTEKKKETMKRIVILLMLTAFISSSFAQEAVEGTREENQLLTAADTNENLRIIIGKNLFHLEDRDTAVNFRVMNRGLSILESLEGPKLSFEKYEEPDHKEWDQEHQERDRSRMARRFNGHWSGIEMGFNNYLFAESMVMPDEISYMSLNTSSSNCFNLNISQLSLGITQHFGIVTGIGFNWNNYRFGRNNSITIAENNNIGELIPDTPVTIKKSKFSTIYLTIPAMLELQIPGFSGHHLNIAAGVIGGIKLRAWTRMVFEDGDKLRTNGDFNLNLLRGGATARVGYGNFMIYGTWYMTPWFQELKGPNGYNLEPFEIGIAFTFND